MATRRIIVPKYLTDLIDDRTPAEIAAAYVAAGIPTRVIGGLTEAGGFDADTQAAIEAKRQEGWPDEFIDIYIRGTDVPSSLSASCSVPAFGISATLGSVSVAAIQVAPAGSAICTVPAFGLNSALQAPSVVAARNAAAAVSSFGVNAALQPPSVTGQQSDSVQVGSFGVTAAFQPATVTAQQVTVGSAICSVPSFVLGMQLGSVSATGQQNATVVVPSFIVNAAFSGATASGGTNAIAAIPSFTIAAALSPVDVVAVAGQQSAVADVPYFGVNAAIGPVSVLDKQVAVCPVSAFALNAAQGVVAVTAVRNATCTAPSFTLNGSLSPVSALGFAPMTGGAASTAGVGTSTVNGDGTITLNDSVPTAGAAVMYYYPAFTKAQAKTYKSKVQILSSAALGVLIAVAQGQPAVGTVAAVNAAGAWWQNNLSMSAWTTGGLIYVRALANGTAGTRVWTQRTGGWVGGAAGGSIDWSNDGKFQVSLNTTYVAIIKTTTTGISFALKSADESTTLFETTEVSWASWLASPPTNVYLCAGDPYTDAGYGISMKLMSEMEAGA